MKMNEHVALAQFTTMKIGGPAQYFCEVSTVDELRDAVRFAKEKQLPTFILGGGSNILARDEGYAGVVIRIKILGYEWTKSDVQTCIVGAGEIWDMFVERSVDEGYVGIENLSLIPGTIGGAVVQNIGAYGGELSSHVVWVEIFDTKEERTRRITRAECNFGYRDSIFKHEGSSWVVLRAGFCLAKNGSPDSDYKDIQGYLHEIGHRGELSAKDIRQAVVAIRTRKLPDLTQLGTAGSFFMNPVVTKEEGARFSEKFPDAPMYAINETHIKLSAGWIIDHVLQLRGVRIGNVGCYEKQALVLVNYGSATAREMHALVKKIQDDALHACGVRLVPEVIDMCA